MERENEDFTQEELVTLGEAEEEPESSESEEAAGEASDEEEAEELSAEEEEQEEAEDETKAVPYARFSKVYGERKTYEEKLDLLKRDPDAYYEQYPDEKPEDKEADKKPLTEGIQDYGNMVVQGGPYEGKTLNEVYEQNPAYANDLLFEYKKSQWEADRAQKDEENRLRQESEAEINTFTAKLSQEIFEKKPDDLDDKEGKKIDDILQQTLDWMNETGRGFRNIEDAYFLMHKDEILSNAAIKGADGLVKQLSVPSLKKVKGTKSGGAKTGLEAYEAMSAEQLDIAIEGMNDADFTEFLQKAPASLKKKHPHIDWD